MRFFVFKQRLIGWLAVVLAVGLLAALLGYKQKQMALLARESQVVSSPIVIYRPPAVRLQINKLNVSLAIVETQVVDNVWPVSPTAANHWQDSKNPGEGGNIVIYGHNTNQLMGPIRWLELGDQISLTNSQGEVFTYTVKETGQIAPDMTRYLQPTDKERLTLYTCDGWFDRQRYLVIAQLN